MATSTPASLVDSTSHNENTEYQESKTICQESVTSRDGGLKADKPISQDQENINPKLNIAPLPERLRMYVPPTNFGAVETGSIYRSGYPSSKNFDFITSLDIRTILTLVPEPLAEDYITFMDQHNIRHYQIHIPANKEGKINITPETMARALAVVLNRQNHPILIHCNRGKHRTGCVTACFRKTQHIQSEAALAEYRDYASPKCRDDDMAFIRSFDPNLVLPIAQSQGWLPTPPPEPSDEFWHLKQPTKIPTFEDMVNLQATEDHEQHPQSVRVI